MNERMNQLCLKLMRYKYLHSLSVDFNVSPSNSFRPDSSTLRKGRRGEKARPVIAVHHVPRWIVPSVILFDDNLPWKNWGLSPKKISIYYSYFNSRCGKICQWPLLVPEFFTQSQIVRKYLCIIVWFLHLFQQIDPPSVHSIKVFYH